MVPLPLLHLVPLPAGSMLLVPLPAAPLVVGAPALGALGKQLLREQQWQARISGGLHTQREAATAAKLVMQQPHGQEQPTANSFLATLICCLG